MGVIVQCRRVPEVGHIGTRKEMGSPDEGSVISAVDVHVLNKVEVGVDIEDDGNGVGRPVLKHRPGQKRQRIALGQDEVRGRGEDEVSARGGIRCRKRFRLGRRR